MQTKRLWKWTKRLGLTAVVLVTLGFLVLAFENYRGRRAWDRYRAETEARGERVDLKAFLPAEVPDAQNFAATPLLAPMFSGRYDPATGHIAYTDSNRVHAIQSLFNWTRHLRISDRGWREAKAVDLVSWQEMLRSHTADADLQALQSREKGTPAADVRFLLRQHAVELEELRGAARRPYSQMPAGSYDDQLATLMTYFGVFKGFARAFQVGALAALAEGDTDAAADDVMTIVDLSATLKQTPLLISGLVRMSALATVHQPLWEGLARRQWTDDQLARFEASLSQVNLVAEMAFWLRGERAFSLSFLAVPAKGQAVAGVDPGMSQLMGRMPGGWRYQNQVAIARMFDDYVFPVLHPESATVDVARLFELEEAGDQARATRHPYRILAMMLLPAIQKTPLKSAQSQADIHLARVACALERYSLAENEYPERLEELVPRFLPEVPIDPVNGQPLHYRRSEDGRYVLYSIGSDLDDDAGRVAPAKRPSQAEEPDGDWVWRY
jgi:hypothetical protein